MKRLFLLAIITIASCCVFTSCEKDEFVGASAKHNYTVTSYLGELGANSIELRFYEYNDKNEMINYNTWDNVQNGAKKSFGAHDLATKLVVYIEADTAYGEFNRYVAQIFYLTTKNTSIVLDGETLVSKYSPI